MIEKLRAIIESAMPESIPFSLEPAERAEFGHYSTNVALQLAKQLNKTPREVAEDLVRKIKAADADGLLSRVEVAGPGFLNFWFSDAALNKMFQEMVRLRGAYGKSREGKKQKIIVEYSDPNIAKQMHVGHLRSTVIGDALANIFDFLGYTTIRWNYIGDWGTQFGKLITAYKLWGDPTVIRKNPIAELQKLYVKFHEEIKTHLELEERGREEFRKLEAGDKENLKLWARFKKESLKEFKKLYTLLGITFDVDIGESFYEKDLHPLVEDLLARGIAEKSQGSIIVPLEGLPPALIQKSDGASLYLTRDIANLRYRTTREEYQPLFLILYVVGNEQSLHFEQLGGIVKKLGWLSGNAPHFRHIKYGLVLGEEGTKLATREGKVILLESVIEEAIRRARTVVDEKRKDLSLKEREKIAKTIAIAALKYNDLSQNRQSDIAFQWDTMLNFEGNSAPYLLYSYARMKSILRKGKVGKVTKPTLYTPHDRALFLKLLKFPEVLKRVEATYFPNLLADYIYDLASATNAFYEQEPVLKAKEEVCASRLRLVQVVADTLKTSLGLLGIKTLERM